MTYPQSSSASLLASLRAVTTALFAVLILTVSTFGADDTKKPFDIPAGSASSALKEFKAQSGEQLLYSSDTIDGVSSKAVKGDLTPKAALEQMFAGTSLAVVQDPANGSLTLVKDNPVEPKNASRAIALDSDRPKSRAKTERDENGEPVVKLDTFEVFGQKTLNMDIPRTKDDPQPYIVVSGDEVRKSGALNLEEYFRTHLPMNAPNPAQPNSSLQIGGISTGAINLRGIGTDQTLILVDGRRIPGVSTGVAFGQPRITGIPPSAIERIEILPATASGIYGGSATGGVINIILKRDFEGFDLEVAYGNAFHSDVGRLQLSLTGGFTLDHGRTRVMVTVSRVHQNELMGLDRSFGRRAFDRWLQNAPSTISTSTLTTRGFGPTPNIVSATGSNLVLDSGVSLNSPWTFVPSGYSGSASDSGAALLANAGHLDVSGLPLGLLASPTTDAASMSVRRDVASNLEAYMGIAWDRDVIKRTGNQTASITIPADSNPFQQSIRVNLPLYRTRFDTHDEAKTESYRTSLGLIARLPSDWMANVDYSLSRILTASRAEGNAGPTPVGLSILQSSALRDLSAFPIADVSSLFSINTVTSEAKNFLEDTSLRLSGPTFRLPGGSLTLTALLEYRREHNDGYFTTDATPPSAPTYYWTPEANQEVKSAYIEARAPILSATNAVSFAREFEVMASARHDAYKTRWAASFVTLPSLVPPFPAQTYATSRLNSTDYTLGLRYSPVRDLAIRASYGTGFSLPRLSSIKSDAPRTGTPANLSLSTITDPRRNGEFLLGDPATGLITRISGGNPGIRPEESKSFSYGLSVTPRSIKGLRLSVDFIEIRKTDEIAPAAGAQFFMDNEAQYPGRVIRAPLTTSDTSAGFTAGRVISIDQSAVNLFHTDVRAFDFQVDYDIRTTHLGDWHAYLIGTRQFSFRRQNLPTVEPINIMGFSDGFLEWSGNYGVDWSVGSWSVGWSAQYVDGYSLATSSQSAAAAAASTAVRAQGTTRVPSQTYYDAYLRYKVRAASWSLWSDCELMLGIQNIFDKSPPILATALSGYSAFGDPRLRRFTLAVRKHLR